MTITHTTTQSPIGELTIVSDGDALIRVALSGQAHLPDRATFGRRDDAKGTEAISQLAEYFAGNRKVFDLPLEPVGTDFQRKVWMQLRAIPFGATWSYGELAEAMGRRGAARAVGMANGRNPLAVIVPCHRVIGADGSLTGYAGGIAAKETLLRLEGAIA